MVEETLKLIEDQVGIQLELDTNNGVIRSNSRGENYFNVKIKDPAWRSIEYSKLDRFAKKYKSIRVEYNGYKRIAIFPIFKQ